LILIEIDGMSHFNDRIMFEQSYLSKYKQVALSNYKIVNFKKNECLIISKMSLED